MTQDPKKAPEGAGGASGDAEQAPQDAKLSVNAAAPGAYDDIPMHCETTQLMSAVQAGDPDAFEELARSLRGRAFQVARSLVGSREDALEMCQETFLKVFSARETYNPSQPFLPWFHRILRNTCFSFLRKNRRVKRQSLSAVGSDGEELDWEIIDPSPGPTAGIEAEEERRLFHVALEQLSARDREILALRHFKELSYKEIALCLDIPEGTVMSRLFHARRRLKKTLGPILEDRAAAVRGDSKEGTTTKGAR